jgi:REP element-mobilizing transposase RayT
MDAVSPGHQALRRGRWSQPGQVYLVTFTTHRRVPVFQSWTTARIASRAIVDNRLWQSSSLLAWVLMPDHWHGLVALGEIGDLPSTIRSLKTNASRHVRRDTPGIERVWASGYHDHALRSEESLRAIARYVVLNPVRAGMVRRVGDYPFWDVVWL